LRARGIKTGRRTAPATISARLGGQVSLETEPNGKISARFEGDAVALGTLSAEAAKRAQQLRSGLPLRSLTSPGRNTDKEVRVLVQRLARHGLLEYHLRRPPHDADQVVIEPQVPDYWPQMPELSNTDSVVLSRFAYMRRRGDDMVLESPRSGALFKICDPKIAAALSLLSTPHQIKRLRREDDFPGLELLALLVDCQILLRNPIAGGTRLAEGDDSLVLWDFHDLLFHTRSTEGRHANPLGGSYVYSEIMRPLPGVRPQWPGKKIDLRKFSDAPSQVLSPAAALLRRRHSVREFDDQRPITLAELSQFLDSSARVLALSKSKLDLGGDGPLVEFTVRPYPSAGGSYELELYLAVDKCEGLDRGFYHYDAGRHALVPIGARPQELDVLLARAAFAMIAPAAPQILFIIAARFGRVSWKYTSIAYELILKDVGVLLQTLYLVATDMNLGGCAIGTANIDLFAKMTGLEFHVEGAVGQFALGRGTQPAAAG